MLPARLLAAACLILPALDWRKPRFAFDPDREEGVHRGVDIEWWYHFGWLEDGGGGEWAWFSSFFRSTPPAGGAYRGQLDDLTDLRTGERRPRRRIGAEAIPLVWPLAGLDRSPPPPAIIPGPPAERPGDPLRLAYGDDLLERTGDRRYRLRAGDVDLELRAVAPPMPVEGTGLTGLRNPADMRYYCIPRLEAYGTAGGRRVRGLFWYDHQWGRAWRGSRLRWSWWGLQLEDGSDVNACVLSDPDASGTLRATLTRDGRPRALRAFPLQWWASPAGTRYPVSWKLEGGDLEMRVDPLFKERECPILGPGAAIWEGPVRVSGTRRGRGFQELVGYGPER